MQRPDAPLHRLPLPPELALEIFDTYTAITLPGTPEFLTLLTLSRYHYALNIRRLYWDVKLKESMADRFVDMWRRWAFHGVRLVLAAQRRSMGNLDEDEILKNLLCPIKCNSTDFNINTLTFENAICFAKISELFKNPGPDSWYTWDRHPSLPYSLRLLAEAKTVVFEEQTLGGGEVKVGVRYGPSNGYNRYGAERLVIVMPSRPFHCISPLALNWLAELGERLLRDVKHVTLEYKTAVVGEGATLFKKRKHRMEQIDQVESKIKSWDDPSLQITVVEPSES
ncbi:hypothetical protein L198_06661 [Cryptococcus wingfieldii CBS 7118]|uniref:Uncharacterized protein n=1 Tax=Cryptococcus wingfieldii CBS 7118 TaxID=1295528 RepID=A0A1E3IIG5_9TREE|nr:hypothetical protein L198_06661 [Cryptococcus wingfieldii CBS 7118]ODN88390.1 hypothetical protein L198_06661 [Cryptococcus wingfieldii CBS 7118]